MGSNEKPEHHGKEEKKDNSSKKTGAL